MDQGTGTHAEFAERMMKIAREAGIVKPIMVLGIKYREEVDDVYSSEFPYLLSSHPDWWGEWTESKREAPSLCEYMPRVFVVDGEKFTFPYRFPWQSMRGGRLNYKHQFTNLAYLLMGYVQK